MTRPITITLDRWELLQDKMKRNYPPSVFLVRDKMKRVLGFTTRYNDWFDTASYILKTDVTLDFFDEAKQTMFLLKYSELLTYDR